MKKKPNKKIKCDVTQNRQRPQLDATNQNEEEGNACPFCFLSPCIVLQNSSARWIGQGQGPSIHNPPIRKALYKRFWSCINYLGGWMLPQYIDKKCSTGESDSIMYHQREIMPDCVLKFCRNKYPNPKDIPYIGHKWQ